MTEIAELFLILCAIFRERLIGERHFDLYRENRRLKHVISLLDKDRNYSWLWDDRGNYFGNDGIDYLPGGVRPHSYNKPAK